MRSIGLDLGVRHIAFCEVVDGGVVDRTTVRSLGELESRLGPKQPPARVAFEACREGWHVHDTLAQWGNEPFMLDTTRIRQIGVGHHRRKNDPIDAEAMAQAVDAGRLPLAHVLSPARRALRAELSVRSALVDTRSQYVTTIRGLARAAGTPIPSCKPEDFVVKLQKIELDQPTRTLIAPLVKVLETIEVEIFATEKRLADFAEKEPVMQLLATVPAVGLIVAATFVSIIDDASRFHSAHAVGAYLGLVPSESTTGGPNKRRLGSITKQGNTIMRSLLVQSSWTIIRARDSEDPLTSWARNLARTRGKKIAATALARKLAGVLWAMWRDGTVYDRAWQARASAAGIKSSALAQTHRAAALERAARKLKRKDPAEAIIRRPPGRPRKVSSEMINA